jgi:hypothetical protein
MKKLLQLIILLIPVTQVTLSQVASKAVIDTTITTSALFDSEDLLNITLALLQPDIGFWY